MTWLPCRKPLSRSPNICSILVGLLLIGPQVAQASSLSLEPCRLKQLPQTVMCGTLDRPLNPATPQGPQIGIRVAVLPAMARHKKSDPIFLLAGGPGQSAIELASGFQHLFGRFRQRRDLVLIDQRGTGQSAPLKCAKPKPAASLQDQMGLNAQRQYLEQCLRDLQSLPHGDLRFYTTSLAMQDLEAVRQALGYDSINLIGASYGTRAGLEYMRLYPSRVRRAVFDGVAPADMKLTETIGQDRHAALEALLNNCAQTPHCQTHYPQLRQDWQALLKMPTRTVLLPHPVTGRTEPLTVDPELLRQWTSTALYSPVTTSAWPLAITQARAGDYSALLALGLGGGGPQSPDIAMGMHLAVVCTEDKPSSPQAHQPLTSISNDFSKDTQRFYQALCTQVPTLPVPPGFDILPASQSPTLLLSGANDPVTPPRHAQRVMKALGPLTHHVTVPHAAHGTLGLTCIHEAVFRFINTVDPNEARHHIPPIEACAAHWPRPRTFVMTGKTEGPAHD